MFMVGLNPGFPWISRAAFVAPTSSLIRSHWAKLIACLASASFERLMTVCSSVCSMIVALRPNF